MKATLVSFATIIFSIVLFAIVVQLIIEHLDRPDVYTSVDDVCIKVVNHRSGDDFNCKDVDVILHNYNHIYSQ